MDKTPGPGTKAKWTLTLVLCLSVLLSTVLNTAVAVPDGGILVVTDFGTLSQRTGIEEHRLRAIASDMGDICEVDSNGDWVSVYLRIRETVAQTGGQYAFVQILGGDGVVPMASQINPQYLKQHSEGLDTFDPITLTDDKYGDLDKDGIQEVPVARLPDGFSGELLTKQYEIAQQPTQDRSSSFVYTMADKTRIEVGQAVEATIAGSPTRYESPPWFSSTRWLKQAVDMKDDEGAAFFLQHGNVKDRTQWANDSGGVAWHIDDDGNADYVMSAACWGGWIAEREYQYFVPQNGWEVFFKNDDGIYPAQRPTAENTLALEFLSRGTRGYFGSTGVSYTKADQVLAEVFFGELSRGVEPALAAFRGKRAAGEYDSDVMKKMEMQYSFYGLISSEYWRRQPASSSATSLVFDVSSSMEEASAGQSKLEAAKDAGQTVLDVLANYSGPGSTTGLATFSGSSESVVEPSEDTSAVRSAISGLYTQSNTDMLAGINVGTSQLAGSSADDKAIFYLSDGMDTAGNSWESIVQAAEEAANQGIAIYTIGFGDQGSLDETLLQEIASVTGGEYRWADPGVAMALVAQFTKSQVVRSGATPLFETTGAIAEGETQDVGVATVPDQYGDLQVVLAWPGSDMDVKLTDPAGTQVEDGYPGFVLTKTERTAQVTVEGAPSGDWALSVHGVETSMPEEPFYALASFRESTGTPPASGGGTPASDGSELWLLILALVGVGGIAAVTLGRKTGGGGGVRSMAVSLGESSAKVNGPRLVDAAGRSYALKVGANTIGRASDNDVVITDASVSRHHCLLALEESGARVRDLQSSVGTKVDGARLREGAISDGGKLMLGEVTLTLRLGAAGNDGEGV